MKPPSNAATSPRTATVFMAGRFRPFFSFCLLRIAPRAAPARMQFSCASTDDRRTDERCDEQSAGVADWITARRGNTERTLTAAAGPSPCDPYRHSLAMRPSQKARPLLFLKLLSVALYVQRSRDVDDGGLARDVKKHPARKHRMGAINLVVLPPGMGLGTDPPSREVLSPTSPNRAGGLGVNRR